MSWRLNPAQAALLIIDVQEKFVSAMHEGPRVVKKIVQAAQIAELFGIPVWVTEQVPDKLGLTVEVLRKAVPNFKALSKHEFSAANVLPADAPRHILLCGFETHGCVRQTTYDLRQKNKNVYVFGDAVSSRSVLDHQLALTELQQDKVLVTSLEAVAWEMVRSAEGDHFKKALAILK
jgi:nicotinamidase-related amidase